MPFLPPNQQRQSTEGSTQTYTNVKLKLMDDFRCTATICWQKWTYSTCNWTNTHRLYQQPFFRVNHNNVYICIALLQSTCNCYALKWTAWIHGRPRLRSASTGCTQLPTVQTSVAQRSFAYNRLAVWNSLPAILWDSSVSLNTHSSSDWKRTYLQHQEHHPALLWRFCEAGAVIQDSWFTN